MLLCLISTGAFAQTTCVQEPGGNYETQSFNSDGSMFNKSCTTAPGGAFICN